MQSENPVNEGEHFLANPFSCPKTNLRMPRFFQTSRNRRRLKKRPSGQGQCKL